MAEEIITRYKLDLAALNTQIGELKTKFSQVESAAGNSANKAATGFVSLRTQVANAKNEVARLTEQFGELSPEVRKAAQAAGELQKRFEENNRIVQAFNPAAKFNVLTQIVTGAAGAFAGLQGALALMGGSGKEAEKILVKIQAALALSQGVHAIFELVEGFKSLRAILGITTVATVAQVTAEEELIGATIGATGAVEGAEVATKSFGATLLASPLLPVVAVLGALTAAYILLSDAAEEASFSVKDLNAAIEADKDITDDIIFDEEKKIAGIEKEITLRKLQGASLTEIANLEKKLTQERIREIDRQTTLNEETLKAFTFDANEEFQKLISGNLKGDKLKEAQENLDGINKEIKAIKRKNEQLALQRIKLNDSFEIIDAKLNADLLDQAKKSNTELVDGNKNKNTDIAKADKELFDELVKQAEVEGKVLSDRYFNELKAQREADNLIRAEIKQLTKDFIDAEEERNKAQKEKAIERAEIMQRSQELIAELFKLSSEINAAELAGLEKTKEKKLADDDEELAKEQRKFDQRLIGQKEFEEESFKIKQRRIADEKNIDRQIAEAKRKQAEADKAKAIFETIINTATAIVKLPADASLLGISLIPFIVALGAAQLATIVAAPIPKFKDGTRYVEDNQPGYGIDRVYAMLNKGERVITTQANAKHWDLYEAIDNNKLNEYILNQYIAPALIAQQKKNEVNKSRNFAENIAQSMTLNSGISDRDLKRLLDRGIMITNLKELAKYIEGENPFRRI